MSRGGDLSEYRRKRPAGSTPEPLGEGGISRPGLFVVQQHAARGMHYDLRLEIGGVLCSWAVPKGPSLSPEDKRLAVATEDHPVEYGDFEGVIPAGSYGAGAMIVWDRGASVHHLDPEEGLGKGKLLFDLKGYKLRGLWTLVRTQKNPKEWLLIKKPDSWATGETVEELDAGSVLSGLTVEELAGGAGRAREIRARLEELGAPRREVDASRLRPMLAEVSPKPFSRPGWLFELKYDGYRLLAEAGPEGPHLRYRSRREATRAFPELARALRALPYSSLLLDGEAVVLDEEARPSFHRLQQRAMLSRARDLERAAIELPAVYYAFDLLAFEGHDLRPLPLAERKELLRRVLPASGPLRWTDHVEERGEELFREIERRGLEGLVAKQADAPYASGRSASWRKIRCARVGNFVVVGFKPPKGEKEGLGSLHLADFDVGALTYRGSAGSGIGPAQAEELFAALAPLARETPACAGLPRSGVHTWVEPRWVAEVRFTELTAAGHLRHPVYLRLRDDKAPEECVREAAPLDAAEEPEEHAAAGDEADAAHRAAPRPLPDAVPLTNLDKVFWPAEGWTKGDLLAYYRAVAPWILPYLESRPVVLDRYPDGIKGKSFFQKNAPDGAPDWVSTASLWSEDSQRETRTFVCEDEATLLYLVNLGTIPLHLGASRLGTLQTPDWCVLDLDAKDAPFEAVVEVARAIHRLCREIELPSYPKTSGATGLHVLVPLGGRLTHEQAKQLAEVMASVVVQENGDIASRARLPAARPGKVYVDALQNGYGKLLVAPFSARPRPGGPVSMPLKWREVRRGLDPGSFNLETAPRRLRRLEEDPLKAVLTEKPDLQGALGRLLARM